MDIKKISGFLSVMIVFGALALPILANAQVLPNIIPCGQSGGPDNPNPNPCTFCHIYVLIANLMEFMVIISIPLAVAAVSWGGVMILTAGGPGSVSRGREIITSALFGVILVFGAWAIVNTLVTYLADPGVFPVPWNKPNCSV